MIASIRVVIASGAAALCQQGVFDDATRRHIVTIAERAPLVAFKPRLVVIPWAAVHNIIRAAELNSRASVLSREYIIEGLGSIRVNC